MASPRGEPTFWDRVNDVVARQNPDELRESCLFATVTHGGMGTASRACGRGSRL